jgi:hypothetical protein
MPFGKHKGEDIEDIPSDYLRWVLEKVDPPQATGNVQIDKDRREAHLDLVSEIEDEMASRAKYGPNQ